jgi:tetratricopeptide (TPR) repeat protein
MASRRMTSDSGPDRDPGAPEPGAGNGPTGSERETGPRIIPLRGARGTAAAAITELPPPDQVEALYYEGMAAYQHRHWEGALDRFTRLKELQPTRPGLDALIEEVRWFLQLQNAAPSEGTPAGDAAAKVRRRGWRAAPWSTRARTILYIVLGILAVAGLLLVAFGDRLPWRENRAAEELYNRGQARLTVGDNEGALAAFQKMLEISPNDPEALLGIERAQRQDTLAQEYAAAEAAIADEDWARAAAELAKIASADPNYRDVKAKIDFVNQRQRLADLYADGGRLYDLGQWNEALAQFEKIRSIDGSYRAETVGEFLFVCYLNAGEALLQAGGGNAVDAKAAVDYFDRALGIHPRNRSASDARRLGGMYLDALQALDRGDSDRARTQLAALVAESPAYAGGQAARHLYDLMLAAGQTALAGGDIPAALERFARAQALPVNDTSAAQKGAAIAMAATPTASPTAPNTPTATSIPTPWASVLAGPVSARSGPGSAFPVIGEVVQGATVAITGRRDDGAWLRVCCTADGKEAWVPSNVLKVSGPLKQAEVVTLPTATPVATRPPRATATPKVNICVQGNTLNVAGGGGLAGWTVRLTDASGVERKLRTNKSGFYRFSDAIAGPATLTLDLPGGWHSVSPVPSSAVLAPGEVCAVVDFWAEQTSNPAPTPIR